MGVIQTVSGLMHNPLPDDRIGDILRPEGENPLVEQGFVTTSFDKVLTYVQFSLSLCSFLTVLGVIVLRFTQPVLPRPYKAWGYPVTPVLFLLISGWMLVHIFRSHRDESLAGLATLLVGLLIYFLSPTRPQPATA